MKSFNHYKMALRPRNEPTTGLALYGETEPAEMQIENLWKIVDHRTGEELADPRPDFSEFSTSDRMYPSMMKPEIKRRWDQKNYEWEETKTMHTKLKRMVHAKFMQENPNLPVVQKLKQTIYGNEIQNEFEKHLSGGGSKLKPMTSQSRTPQIGTGKSIRDEMQRDNVDINEIADEVLQFLTPKTESTYAVLAVNRDENLRIEDKLLVSAESSHVLEYQYDEGGRLRLVKYNGENVEIYRYNQMGQRVFSHVASSDKQEYRYNDLDQLIRAGETTYTYDEDGDLSEKNSPEGITRYEYLKTGQLCEVHLPDGTDIEYRFNKRGFRTAKYINSQLVQRYQWKDSTTLTAVEDAEGISKFHYNEHGRVMGMSQNGQVFLFATDQLGSIFTVADSSGNSVQDILYDSFGRRVYNSASEHDLVLGFAAGLHDSDTGLIHFGYREYDPVMGRFISPDPLCYEGGDVDLYGYCLDDPINFVDRDGLHGSSERTDDENENEDSDDPKNEKSEDSKESGKEAKKAAKKKGKNYLKRLVGSAAKGAVRGFFVGGGAAGPAGAATGTIVGPAIQMLYDVSSDAVLGKNKPNEEAENSIREQHDVLRENNKLGRR
ncbi:RHS repeat-associated core domain-containing protein [Desulfovibrio sp. UCD-KL4C]|uniref:RHS repeat domain-containing protein n=1 Tax=Desulfovibrio sp. UCD-KL4C TaxID=2578120 RepID=UPI0025C580AA|nr:RHS repeat-associated core domain-containing protein [Desulfovibrio sp. UCD-KL4C]